MAVRPWLLPSALIDYSDFKTIKKRASSKLTIDIARAESAIIDYCGHDFSNNVLYPEIPTNVVTATILLAERYGIRASKESNAEGLKRESFDDYSYEKFDKTPIESLDLIPLLSQFCDGGETRVDLKMVFI